MFDLVIPVYNSFHHVRACLASVFKHSTLPYHAYILNDCSDQYTTESLKTFLTDYNPSCFTLINNEKNLGYLKNCNQGIRKGSNEFVVLINSDTIVTRGYLEKVKATFSTDTSIGIINPVSTWANWTRIPFPNGFNINDISAAVENYSDHTIKDINNASGFFFATRRKLYDELGLFDEVYDPGYYEEADFCMKAIAKGYRVVVNDSLYIFHYGWGSFMEDSRNKHMQNNKQIFLSRWGNDYKKIEDAWKQNNPIGYLQQQLNASDIWKAKDRTISQDFQLSRNPDLIKYQLERIKTDADEALRLKLLIDKTSPKEVLTSNNPKITYILPAISLYGGIIPVLQIVNRLALMGFDVNVATYGKLDDNIYRLLPFYFRPYVFPNVETLIAEFPTSDLVVATHWETVYPALLIKARTGAKLAYFVQDFEADFYDRSDLAQQALLTYRLIPDQIVKTQWLKSKLEPFGGSIEIIPLGLNLDMFHDFGKPRRKQVVAMARPSSERRNYPILKQVYEKIFRTCPEIELAVYGIGHDVLDFSCPVKDYGRLEIMQDVAKALNDSTVLLDCSTFQGFGRPGLEAMACGTAAVLTRCGGITQYAKHNFNCFLIDPMDVDEITAKTIELANSDSLRTKFVANGQKTANEYSYINEGIKTAEYLNGLLRK